MGLSETAKGELYEAIGKPCPYCKTKMIAPKLDARRRIPGNSVTTDHAVIPKVEGGTREQRNKLICCRTCNNLKGSMRIWDWIALLKAKHNFRWKIVEATWTQLCVFWPEYRAKWPVGAYILGDVGETSKPQIVSRESSRSTEERESALV